MNTGAQTFVLDVEGMHCQACVRRLTGALSRLPGVEVNRVDIGRAVVTVQPAGASSTEILKAVSDTGFTARIPPSGGAAE